MGLTPRRGSLDPWASGVLPIRGGRAAGDLPSRHGLIMACLLVSEGPRLQAALCYHRPPLGKSWSRHSKVERMPNSRAPKVRQGDSPAARPPRSGNAALGLKGSSQTHDGRGRDDASGKSPRAHASIRSDAGQAGGCRTFLAAPALSGRTPRHSFCGITVLAFELRLRRPT